MKNVFEMENIENEENKDEEIHLPELLKKIVEPTETDKTNYYLSLLEIKLKDFFPTPETKKECEKYLKRLFKILGELDSEKKNEITLNIYFPLCKIYQQSKIFQRCFTPQKAFSKIINLKAIYSKINYFTKFIKNFNNIDIINERDIIELYNSFYLDYLIQKNECTPEAQTIQVFCFLISYFIRSVINKTKTFASYLLIIDSFFEAFIIIEIELMNISNINKQKVIEINELLKTFLNDLSDFLSNTKYYNKTLMIKIILFLCYFTSFLQNLNEEDYMTPICEVILYFIKKSDNYLLLLLHQVLDALFSQNSMNQLQKQLSKSCFFPYLQNIANSDSPENIIKNSKLADFEKIFQQMLNITNDCNVYKGALFIISLIMKRDDPKIKTKNHIKGAYYPYLYFSFFEKLIKQEGKGNKNYYNEILLCIPHLIYLEGSRFTQREWDKVLSFSITIKNKINNSEISKKLAPIFGEIVYNIHLLFKTHSIVLVESHKTTIAQLIGFLIRKEQTVNYEFIIELISDSSEELVDILIDYYFQQYFYSTQKIDDKNKDKCKIIRDIFRTIKSLIYNGSNKMKAMIEKKMTKYYEGLIKRIVEDSKNTSIDKSKIDKIYKTLSKIMIQILDFSENDENFIYLVEKILSYREDNWMEKDCYKSLADYAKNTFTKMLIKFNDILKTKKMKIILNTVFIQENYLFQKNTFLFYELLDSLDFTNNNQVIFWKTVEEKESQTFPCLFYKKTEIKIKEEKYFTFLDFEKIFQKIISQFSQKIKGFLGINNSNNNNNSMLFITKNFIMICNVLVLGMEKPHLFSKQNIYDLLNCIVNAQIFEKFLTNDYQEILKIILKIISRLNYLLNYQNTNYFLGEIATQNNDVFYHFENNEKLKDKIYELFKNYLLQLGQKIKIIKAKATVTSKEKGVEDEIKRLLTKNKYHIPFKLMAFLLYSSNENLNNLKTRELVKCSSEMESDINSILSILYTLLFTLENIDLDDCLFIVGTLFHLKNQVYFCEPKTIIKCIHLSLTFAYPEYANEILLNFAPFIGDVSNEKVAKINTKTIDNFFIYFCDTLTLTYISFIDGVYEIKNPNHKRNFFNCYEVIQKIFKKLPKLNRISLFQSLVHNILIAKSQERDNLTNLDKITIKQHIDKMKIFRAKNEVIGIRAISNYKCEVVVFSSISNIKFTMELNNIENKAISKEDKLKQVITLFDLSNEESNSEEEQKISLSNQIMEKNNVFPLTYFCFEKMIKTYKEKNIEQDETCNELSKAKIIQLINIPVNFTFFVNVWFYNPKTDEYSNNIFNYTDRNELPLSFINFLSSLGNVSYNDKGERALIYKDEFYTVEFKLCNCLKTSKNQKIQMIEQNKINLIWINNSRIDIDQINKVFNLNESSCFYLFFISPVSDSHCFIRKNASSKKEKIESLFIHDYIININSLSSIRYFMNNIILLCEWFEYYNENEQNEAPSKSKDRVIRNFVNNVIEKVKNSNSTPDYIGNDNLSKRLNLINQICGVNK